MYELRKVGSKTYYMECPSKVGFYLLDDNNVCVIDTGSSRDYGRIILKTIKEKGWNLKLIINTHFHADHIGGNNYLEKHTNCDAYVSSLENVITQNPIISPMMLYGANPLEELKSKFVIAEKSNTKDIEEIKDQFEIIELPGHTTNQIGIKTNDGVVFIGDALVGKQIIEKYTITYIYDVGKYLETLDKLETLEGNLFIASHAEAVENLDDLIKLN
ncbi:MAG: MBL fold metallo-hydrolase, partial [Tenericutes bacterium]|nr:MBL fold metallo-hydrolase [Mycoplasmatota bacterium]